MNSAENTITPADVAETFSYDPATGKLTWLCGRAKGQTAGTINSRGYVRIMWRCREFKAHRLGWAIAHGKWPDGEIDHINRDRADNRLSNLRDVSRSLNRQNEDGPHRQNRLGVRGVKVAQTPGKYVATIKVGEDLMHLGTFPSIEAAQSAYESARAQYHPGSPRANLGPTLNHIRGQG